MDDLNNENIKPSSVDSNPNKIKKTITIDQNRLIYILITIALVIVGIMAGILYGRHHDKYNLAYSNQAITRQQTRMRRSAVVLRNRNFGIVNAISSSSITILDKSANLVTYTINSNTKVISESSGQTLTTAAISTGSRVYLKTKAINSNTLSLIVIRPTLTSNSTSTSPTPTP